MNPGSQKESSEMIRKEMEETKQQLAEKLEALRNEIVETVQTTEKAVTATVGAVQETVGAVQETVETVTGEFHEAVQSVSHAFDLSRHVDRHPWLVIGGASLIGYVAAELLTSHSSKTSHKTESIQAPTANLSPNTAPEPAINPVTSSVTPVPHDSISTQLRDAAIQSVIALIPGITSRIVPRIVDHLAKQWDEKTKDVPKNTGDLPPQSASEDIPDPGMASSGPN